MTAYSFTIEALQVVILLLAATFTGWVRTVKCRMQGRTYAGIFQPYRVIAKLFSKEVMLAQTLDGFSVQPDCQPVSRVTGHKYGDNRSAVRRPCYLQPQVPDAIALVMLFAIIRFFTALAGMDIGTAFGGMGSSREMTISSLAEPAMLMAVFTVSLAANSTSLTQMVKVIGQGDFILRPSLAFAVLAFIMVHLTETGRVPVDNPATHLELTMIHEAMILEYSG